MTMNKFDNLLSNKKTSEEPPIDKLLNQKSFSSDEILKELETGGFSQKSFSEALLSYTTYTSDNFEKPKKFTESIKIPDVHFTNHVNLMEDNTILINNIKLLQENIAELLPDLTVIEKGTRDDRRLVKICNFYDWDLREEVDPEIFNLYKFDGEGVKNKNGSHSNPFRVYVGIKNITEDNKKICLLFIDPYHLAIPSGHKFIANGPWLNREKVKEIVYSQNQYNKNHIYELIGEKITVE